MTGDTQIILDPEAAGSAVARLRGIADQAKAVREQPKRDALAEARAQIEPLLDEARAAIDAIRAARKADLTLMAQLVELNFDDLRKSVPVTAHQGTGNGDGYSTLDIVAQLRLAAHAAFESLSENNAVALRSQASMVETQLKLGAAKAALDNVPELRQLVQLAKGQSDAIRVNVRNAKLWLTRLNEDLEAGSGNPQTPQVPAERVSLPPLPKRDPRSVNAPQADTAFDPFNYEPEGGPQS